MGIFSASMLTTAVSIVHGVYVFSPNRNAEGIWAHVLVSSFISRTRLGAAMRGILSAETVRRQVVPSRTVPQPVCDLVLVPEEPGDRRLVPAVAGRDGRARNGRAQFDQK